MELGLGFPAGHDRVLAVVADGPVVVASDGRRRDLGQFRPRSAQAEPESRSGVGATVGVSGLVDMSVRADPRRLVASHRAVVARRVLPQQVDDLVGDLLAREGRRAVAKVGTRLVARSDRDTRNRIGLEYPLDEPPACRVVTISEQRTAPEADHARGRERDENIGSTHQRGSREAALIIFPILPLLVAACSRILESVRIPPDRRPEFDLRGLRVRDVPDQNSLRSRVYVIISRLEMPISYRGASRSSHVVGRHDRMAMTGRRIEVEGWQDLDGSIVDLATQRGRGLLEPAPRPGQVEGSADFSGAEEQVEWAGQGWGWHRTAKIHRRPSRRQPSATCRERALCRSCVRGRLSLVRERGVHANDEASPWPVP